MDKNLDDFDNKFKRSIKKLSSDLGVFVIEDPIEKTKKGGNKK